MSFEPSKQRSYAISKKFLVPKVEPWFSVFHEYMRRIQRDLKLSQGADVDLLWTGRSGTGVGESKFIKSPLGKDQVYNTPKYIAKRLGKKDWKTYSGHTPRRTAGTKMADSGASHQVLQNMFGWKNPGTASEYCDNSKAARRDQAKRLTSLSSDFMFQSNEDNQIPTTPPRPRSPKSPPIPIQAPMLFLPSDTATKPKTESRTDPLPMPEVVPSRPDAIRTGAFPADVAQSNSIKVDKAESNAESDVSQPQSEAGDQPISSGVDTTIANFTGETDIQDLSSAPLPVMPALPRPPPIPAPNQGSSITRPSNPDANSEFMKFLEGASMTGCSIQINVNNATSR